MTEHEIAFIVPNINFKPMVESHTGMITPPSISIPNLHSTSPQTMLIRFDTY